MRNLLATVPQGARGPIAAIVRTIFAQPDYGSAMAQLHKVADGLPDGFPKLRRSWRKRRRTFWPTAGFRSNTSGSCTAPTFSSA
jgi:transposase-like protein